MNKFLSVVSMMALLGCQSSEYKDLEKLDAIDQYGKLTRDDFKKGLIPAPVPETKIETKRPPIPKASDILLKPQKPQIGVNKTVSISVTEDVPIKDVFLELSKLADVDIEIDPGISSQGVIFRAKNKPFQDVVERLTVLAGLRYEVNDGILKISQDVPYIKNYQMNFLNLIRSNSGSIDVNANVLSAGEDSSDSLSTGSQNSISSSYDGDIWASVEANLQAVVNSEEDDAININRQSSLVTIRGSDVAHRRAEAYLNTVKEFYSAQVLIEAKVVEVQLSDQYRSGVDWTDVDNIFGFSSLSSSTLGFIGSTNVDNGNIATFNLERGDLAGAVSLASVFGTTRTLSSPRILAINNQQAVMTFARNEIFYDITLEEETEEGEDGEDDETTITVESERQTIPIGIILSLQPLVDKQNDEVVMTVRPTLSRTTGEVVQNPALALQVALLNAGLDDGDQITGDALNSLIASASVPQVEVREMDSVLRIKSGQIMAIGGMIEERAFNQDSGVPYLSEIPIIGNAFKTVDQDVGVVQTVIFLKATIVPGYGVEESDQKFYNTFTNDPRPLKF